MTFWWPVTDLKNKKKSSANWEAANEITDARVGTGGSTSRLDYIQEMDKSSYGTMETSEVLYSVLCFLSSPGLDSALQAL